MDRCPDCCLPCGTAEEIANSPDDPWCECPLILFDPYVYGEEDDPE